jgi:CRISPR-associated protein Csb2
MFNPLAPAPVAGMVRHAARLAAEGGRRDAEWIKTYVAGHGDGPSGQAKGPAGGERFSYVPLPTVEERPRKDGLKFNVLGGIRRVLVVEPAGGSGRQIEWARRALSGQDLIDEATAEAVGLLSVIPNSDGRLRHYVGASDRWTSVSPVVLPGYDDRHGGKAEGLFRKAIGQAGFPAALAEGAELEWRPVGYWPGAEHARRFAVPAYLESFPRYHFRVHWRDRGGRPVAVRGPVCLGAGRYSGLGLFATELAQRRR